MSFEQIFKNIDDLLYKDSGVDSELDDIGQTSNALTLLGRIRTRQSRRGRTAWRKLQLHFR